MHQRTVLGLLAGTLLALVINAAAALAQITMCAAGSYTVDLTNLPTGSCYPITIGTSWTGGGSIWNLQNTFNASGTYSQTPGAPAGSTLNAVRVCGTIITSPFPTTTVGCNGCAICVRICTDPITGCLVIKLYPGTACASSPCP